LIAAIVLAAGKSVRFGQPKLLMPWGKSTVIEHIIQTIRRSGIKDIHVVVDSARQDLVDTLKDLNVQIHSADGDCEPSMLISLQTGLKNAQPEVNYAMIVLGDQPTITSSLVELIVSRIKKPTTHHCPLFRWT